MSNMFASQLLTFANVIMTTPKDVFLPQKGFTVW